MSGRYALKEDLGFWRINISVYPSSPSSESFVKCDQTVHICILFITLLHVFPSVTYGRYRISIFCLNKTRKWDNGSYGWDLPVWVHQCQELKMSMSMPSHALPPFIESSFKTTPSFSLTRSTRNGVRYSNIVTPYSCSKVLRISFIKIY